MKTMLKSVFLAAIACITLTGCDSSASSDAQSSDDSSAIAWTKHYVGLPEAKGIEQSLLQYDLDKELNKYLNQVNDETPYFKFTDTEFEYNIPLNSTSQNPNHTIQYQGTYIKEENRIKLSYRKMTAQTPKNAAENVEPFTEMHRSMNDASRLNLVLTGFDPYKRMDKAEGFHIIPDFWMQEPLEDFTPLCETGPFLSAKTYGTTLYASSSGGKYQPGKTFTIQYNPMQTLKDNHRSIAYDDKWVLDQAALKKAEADYHYFSKIPEEENLVTDIRFLNGRWTWVQKDGTIINEGGYTESTQYPGLIYMYLTECRYYQVYDYRHDSFLLYLGDDRNIYFPAYIQTDHT